MFSNMCFECYLIVVIAFSGRFFKTYRKFETKNQRKPASGTAAEDFFNDER